MQSNLNLNSKISLNPFAPDFEFKSPIIEWTTPKPKPKPYVPNSEVKKISPYSVSYLLDHVEDFKICNRVKEFSNYYFPITFEGIKCQIETPLMTELFGVLNYNDPPRNKDVKPNKAKYSIHLCMDDSTKSIYDFHCLCESLDTIAAQHFKKLKAEDIGLKPGDPTFKNFTLFSSLRQNRKDYSKPLALRVKVPSEGESILCQLFNEGELLPQDIETFKKYVKHSFKVRAILEINPIWIGTYTEDKKFGISYKLIALKVEREKIEFKEEKNE